jgi:hypothetical protein
MSNTKILQLVSLYLIVFFLQTPGQSCRIMKIAKWKLEQWHVLIWRRIFQESGSDYGEGQSDDDSVLPATIGVGANSASLETEARRHWRTGEDYMKLHFGLKRILRTTSNVTELSTNLFQKLHNKLILHIFHSYVDLWNDTVHNSVFVNIHFLPCRRGLVVSSPPATEETGAMGCEIESRPGICKVVALKKTYVSFWKFSP